MQEIHGEEYIDYIVNHSELTLWTASKAMHRAGQYLDNAVRRGRVLGLDTAARLADVCGCDLVISDRESGESIARIVARDEHAEQEQTDD